MKVFEKGVMDFLEAHRIPLRGKTMTKRLLAYKPLEGGKKTSLVQKPIFFSSFYWPP